MLTYPHFKPHFAKADWTLPRVLEHQARVMGDRLFLQWTGEGKPYSFDAVNRKVNQLARGLRRLGLVKGDRVVLLMPNCLDYLFSWFAINKLGAVEAPINLAYKGSFLEHQVNVCSAETIIVDEELVDRIDHSLPRMPKVKRVILRSRNASGAAPRAVGHCSVHRLNDLYDADDSNLGVDIEPRDLAAILFTSGTTGPSKGVMMPHAQLYFFSEQDVQLAHITSEDTYFTGFPLFHGNAQFLTVYPCLIAGARCVLYERFSATNWVECLHASGATLTNSLGVTLPFIYAQPPQERDATHKLRRICAYPTPPEMSDAFKARFGIDEFLEAFGQTEICLPFMTPSGAARPKGACGVLVDQWFDVRLINPETDEDVPDGEVGELVVRHKEPWILNIGYAAMPDKTNEACRNLWFHTGDGLRRDKDGWYYFVDRMKDALRRRGENISSFEVEEPIRDHPAVLDVAVIAVPADVEGGEDEVKVCVVLRPDASLAPEALMAWCEERMPHFAVPRYVEYMQDLPRTPSEKVQKVELRRAGVNAATWDRQKAGYVLKDERASKKRKAAS